MEKLTCIRCGYEWMPRIESRPKSCPGCKQRSWDTPKRPRVVKTDHVAMCQYPVFDLAVGEDVLLPFYENGVMNATRNATIRGYGRRTGKSFKIDGLMGKCRVTRIA